MGKFDGILLCTDLDDTLLTTDKRVSDENRRAIEYFQSEGGLFTFVTGRVPAGARLMLEYIHPNAPVVCFNGAAIYDFEKEKFLWKKTLPPVGYSSAPSMCKSVDLPEPLGPVIAVKLPCSKARLISCTACTAVSPEAYVLESASQDKMAMKKTSLRG